jgi:hypothetical protein
MSAWILGSEIAASLDLLDFEFACECVLKGLQPHDGQGQPYRPADVVQQFIAGLEHELAQHDDLAWNLFALDREEMIANQIQPLQKRIQDHQVYLRSLDGAGWEGFEFPQGKDLSAHFIKVLLNSLYLKADAEKFHSAPAEPAVAVPLQARVKAKKPRRQELHKNDCRAAAQKIWAESPGITIEDMIQRDEIANACEGVLYREKTIRNWIKDLCPDRKPGRRKKKAILISL